MRALRYVRALVCYHLYMWWPDRWQYSRPALAILHHAGSWAHASAIRAMGRDPWGPPVSEEDHRAKAAMAFAEIHAILDKAEREA